MATTPQIPNMNPTGVFGVGGTMSPPTGGAGNMNFGNTMNPNPTTPTQVANGASGGFNQGFRSGGATGTAQTTTPGAPTTSLNAGGSSGTPTTVTGQSGQTSTSQNSFDQTSRQQDRTLSELQSYYGEGMGSMIYQYLQSGGGYNSALTQQAVDSQTNAMQQQVQLGANDLTSMLSSMGISGGSSSMTGSLTNYMNQATTQENAITSQEYYNMWNQSQNREEQMLQQAGQTNATGTANQGNWMSDLTSGLNLVGDIGQAFPGIPIPGI